MMLTGEIVEADFEKDELRFRMKGAYQVQAGDYVIIPATEYWSNYKAQRDRQAIGSRDAAQSEDKK